MALIVTDPRGQELDEVRSYWLYCCNDSLGTREIFDILYPRLDEQQQVFYRAGMAFLSPTMAMTLRGVRVDEAALAEALKMREQEELEAIEKLRHHPEIAAVWDEFEPWVNSRDGLCPEGRNHNWAPRGAQYTEQQCSRCGARRAVLKPLNPHSSQQMGRLLYEKLSLKKRYSRKTGEVTTDDEALEALARRYPEHAELIDAILSAREARKQVSVLKSRRDFDGRWRASFNVNAAETDRMSSSKSPYRTGSNLQNIADRSRNIFVADPGLMLFYADLEQAESRIVAADAECEQDLADHASGDTHTGLAVTLFPELPWPPRSEFEDYSSWLAACKKVAATPLPWDPEHDYRFIAKVVRHGTNIGMSPHGIARLIHQPVAVAKRLYEGYFERYPENRRRQAEIRREVRELGALTGPLGRTRVFLGRPWDEQTAKEALAQTQQSTVAHMLNIAMWRIWRELDSSINISQPPRPTDPNKVWLLGQIHDAILGLVRPGDDETLCRVKEILETPIVIRGREVVIPAEILVGPTWRKKDMVVWRCK